MTNAKRIFLCNADLKDNVAYQTMKRNCWGNGTLGEINKDGSINLCFMASRITSEEITKFTNAPVSTYYYERYNKSAIIICSKFADTELMINPTYYPDNRYELFKQGTEKDMYIYIIDSISDKVVATKHILLKNRMLDMFRKSFELNSHYSKEEYNNWIDNVLYINSIKDNIKISIQLGKCYETEPIKVY